MGVADILVFVAFVVAVIGIGLWKSRGEQTRSEHGAQDYFLAGRGLTWWLVGFSLIAANISTEQFVGMSGQAANWLGMAIASYEWMAAITLVVVAFLFLPTFLKSGIYTIPEFLEYRYNTFARTVMAVSTLIILVGVPTASVIYSGAKVITVNFQGQTLFGHDLGSITVGCWIIGSLAAVYVFAGGLKACAWADLIQGSALIVGGAVIAWLALRALGSADPAVLAATATVPVKPEDVANAGVLDRLRMLNAGDWTVGKLHMVKPASDPSVPWTALVVGLWIPNFFYWGLNQYITQRTLGSKSLVEGQRGVVFAAFLKLLPVFIFIVPGMVAVALAKTGRVPGLAPLVDDGGAVVPEVAQAAFPLLVQHVLPPGARGVVVAGLLAALMSSLAGTFNACSTLFTMDLYQKIRPRATEHQLVWVGRIATTAMVLIGLMWIPVIQGAKGLYDYLQGVQGYLGPPIFTVFFLGVFSKRVNGQGCLAALVVGFLLGLFRLAVDTPVSLRLAGFEHGYREGSFLWIVNNIYFQYYSAFIFIVSVAVLLGVSALTAPPDERRISGLTYATVTEEERRRTRASWSRGDVVASAVVLAVILAAYLYFNG